VYRVSTITNEHQGKQQSSDATVPINKGVNRFKLRVNNRSARQHTNIVVTFGVRFVTNEPIKIAVGVDSAYVSLYLSKQHKLFEKHGVNVELIQFAQGGDALDAVAAGQAPMGGAAEPTTLIRAARTDIKVIGIYGQSGSYIKFVAKAGISDPTQLKKVGVVPGSVSEFSTDLMLAKFNIDPERQASHPRQCLRIERTGSVSEPASGQSLTRATGRESAAAIGRASGEVFLAVAFDHMAPRLAYQLDGRGRISPIGHDVTRANNAVGRNAELRRLIEERPRCFEIAVRASEHDQRAVAAKNEVRASHSV